MFSRYQLVLWVLAVQFFPAGSSSTNSSCENTLSRVLGSESVVGRFGVNLIEFWKRVLWEFWVSPDRVLKGFWVSSRGVHNEFWMNSAWALNEFRISLNGLRMSYAWILIELLHAFCRSSGWMSNEFYLNSQWVLHGVCMSSECVLHECL